MSVAGLIETHPATPVPEETSGTEWYSWYVLGVLTLTQTCHGIDRAIIGLVLAPVGKEFGFSDGELGFLAGFAYGIFFAIAAIPFGIAVDRTNRRNIMTVALTIWSGATALCGLATGYWSLLAGRAAVGTAEAAGSPTGMSLISDYFGPDKRATAIGLWYVSSGMGLAIALFVGGAIVQSYGWRWAFFAAGIPGLLLAPLLFFTVREPRRGARDAQLSAAAAADLEGASLGRRVRLLLARPGIAHCIVAIVLIATGIYGLSVWVTTFLIRVHGLPIAQAGLMAALGFGVLGSVGGLLVGWLADRLNRRMGGFEPARTAMLGAVIPFMTAIAGLGTVMFEGLTPTLVFMMIAGFFCGSYNGPIYAVIVHLAGPKLRGLAVSLVQLSANLIGVGAGAWLIGYVSDSVGGTRGVAWGIGAAMIFVLWGGIHLVLASRSIRRAGA